jgi:ureidoacrylate peracid hydrolase
MKRKTPKAADSRTSVRPSGAQTRIGAPKRGRAATPTAANPGKAAAYGPVPHNAWTRDAAGVSLVRKPHRPQPVRFDAEPLPLQIDVAASALLVVDMQNDFCHPQGWFGQKGIDVRPMRKPIPVIAKLLPAWRKAGGRVVWLNWGVRPDRLNLSPTLLFKSTYNVRDSQDTPGYAERSPVDKGRAVVAGDWGAQLIDEFAVAASDITVYKHRLSGFWDNELDSLLRQQGITTLLFAGVNTDRCVFSTLQDAGFLGYDCVLLADACSTPSPAYVTRAIHFIVRQLHGFVATSQALLDGLPPSASSLSQPSRPSRT